MSNQQTVEDKFENWMNKKFEEPEWDEGYNRNDVKDAFYAGLSLYLSDLREQVENLDKHRQFNKDGHLMFDGLVRKTDVLDLIDANRKLIN